MPESFGEAFPTRNIQEGHRHQDKATDLVYRYLGGAPTDMLNWLVDGGTASSDPDMTGWGANQEGANWYNTSLGAMRLFNGSTVSSL